MADLGAIREAIVKGNRAEIAGLVQTALNNGADPQDLINNHMIRAMGEVGARFEAKKIFVPEMMIAARTMQTGLDIIKPLIEAGGGPTQKLGTVVIGTVYGDLHDIGKNLVVLMMESSGFEVHDLGENVPPEKFVQAASELQADVVGMSSLLTTGDPHVKAAVEALRGSHLAAHIKVICGGAAVTEKFALEECGAHGHAPDAVSAVRTVNKLLGLS